MSRLSVIICVYNTDEDYFKSCLDSLFGSSEKDLEVIVVDDGSTKNYETLLKDYKNIKYFKTENQGTLKARIFGAKQATSPYVCYMDSDDTVTFAYYEAMLKKAEETDADIIFNDWAFHTEKSRYVCSTDLTISKNISYNNSQVLEKFMAQKGLQHSYYVLWNKIFKRTTLMQALEKVEELNFEKMLFAEDVLITFFIFALSQKACNVHLGYYFYRTHRNQQVLVQTKEKLENHIICLTSVFNVMEEELKNLSKFEEYKDYLAFWKRLLCSNNYCTAKSANYKDLYPVLKEKYNVTKLQGMPFRSERYYSKHKLLPNNLSEIDAFIKKIYSSKTPIKVFAKHNSYAKTYLTNMKAIFSSNFEFVYNKTHADVIMPKEKTTFKQRILHNPYINEIGVFLFSKGSKIRKFFKSKL